jgi:hypothetical protein
VNSWAECHAATILTRLAVFSLAVFSLALVTGGCDSFTSARAPEATAQFGVFFGGQLQRREELPFVLDASKQRQGFRVEMNEPLRAPTALEWELSRPARRAGNQAFAEPVGRVTELGKAELQSGQRRFEHDVVFKPGDPLGLWNIRVVLQGRVLLDRPFTVYDSQQRQAARRRTALPDAGL